MLTADSSWQDLIPPEDPRYESWLLMRAFIQGEHNAATEQFLSALQKGNIQLADVLKFFERCIDGLVEPMVMAVTGTVSAEQLARNLDRGSEKILEMSKSWFPVIASSTGIDAHIVETEFTVCLATRVAAWKRKAFRIALDEEIARSRKLPESESEQHSDGTHGTDPKDQDAARAQAAAAANDGGEWADRRALVDAYIEEVFQKTGNRITRTDIWKATGDKSRTEFERWESYWYEKRSRKTNEAANRRFTRILTEKPHLK
jgi:hypothetical protein